MAQLSPDELRAAIASVLDQAEQLARLSAEPRALSSSQPLSSRGPASTTTASSCSAPGCREDGAFSFYEDIVTVEGDQCYVSRHRQVEGSLLCLFVKGLRAPHRTHPGRARS